MSPRREPVDSAKLDELARLTTPDGSDMLTVLAGVFLDDEAPGCLAAMRMAASNRDTAELARQAHKLRGSAAVFGASRLVELCQQIETNGPLPTAGVADVERELEGVAQALRARASRP